MIEHCLQAEVFVTEIELLARLLFVLDFTEVKNVNYTLRAFENPLAVRRIVTSALSLLVLGNLWRKQCRVVTHLYLVQLLLSLMWGKSMLV